MDALTVNRRQEQQVRDQLLHAQRIIIDSLYISLDSCRIFLIHTPIQERLRPGLNRSQRCFQLMRDIGYKFFAPAFLVFLSCNILDHHDMAVAAAGFPAQFLTLDRNAIGTVAGYINTGHIIIAQQDRSPDTIFFAVILTKLRKSLGNLIEHSAGHLICGQKMIITAIGHNTQIQCRQYRLRFKALMTNLINYVHHMVISGSAAEMFPHKDSDHTDRCRQDSCYYYDSSSIHTRF